MDLLTPDPRPAGAKTQRGLILSIVGIATALILALVLVNRPDASNQQFTLEKDSAEKKVAASAASRCGLPGLEKTATLTEAPEVPWALIGDLGAPEVAGSDPGVVWPDGFRYC